MYKRAIVDELGYVMYWCSELSDKEIMRILAEYPEATIKCVEMEEQKMYKYIISYDGGQLRDSGDFEWGLFDSHGEAEEAANNAKEEYMNDWNIENSKYDPDYFCIEIEEVQIMKRTPKVIKRWMIANMEDARPQDTSYYNGALKALEFAGYEWKRDADGKHTLFKQIEEVGIYDKYN